MNYEKWKHTYRSVVGLNLDPKNPRIPPSTKPWTQPELAAELVLHDDVYELAKNIAANGFFPTEPLIAVREKGELFVVEGNRRLAACKLLVTPQLSPDSFKSKFVSLAANFDIKLLKKIPVHIAPSRDAAYPLIIARHTATQIAKWQPAMQAHFYHTLVQSGASIEDVAAKFHLSPTEIKKALISHNLYTMACRLDLEQDVASIVRDPRKFSLSTLIRVFESPENRKFFGIEFSDDGKVVGNIKPEEFSKGFKRAVKEVATGEIDSRKHNTPAQIQKHLAGYDSAATPDLAKKGKFDSSTFMMKAAAPATSNQAKKPGKAKPATLSKSLIPSDVKCNSTNARVRDLFAELRKLNCEQFPNATAFAFRCLVELSTFCYLDAAGEIAKMRSAENAKITAYNANVPPGRNPKKLLPNDWSPDLGDMLKWIADPAKQILTGHLARSISTAIHDEKDLISLNLVVHNPTYPASERRLRESWGRWEAYIKLLIA